MKGVSLSIAGAGTVTKILQEAAAAILGIEERLNTLDSGCGDGDCGSTHAVGVKGKIFEKKVKIVDPPLNPLFQQDKLLHTNWTHTLLTALFSNRADKCLFLAAILEALPSLDTVHPWVLLQELGELAEKMGGTSGGVYSLFFTGAARAFQVHWS